MNGLVFAILLLLAVGIIAFLLVTLFTALANRRIIFAVPEQDNITYIVAGQKLKAVWANIEGYMLTEDKDLSGRQWLVRTESKKEWLDAFFRDASPATAWLQKLLWNWQGIRYISLFFWNVQVHTFKVDRKRLGEGVKAIAGQTTQSRPCLKDRVEQSPKSEQDVDSLLFMVPRPIYMEGLELPGDNAKINLLFLAVFQTVIPTIPVFHFKGEFFSLLDASMESVVIDFLAKHRVEAEKETGKFLADTHPKLRKVLDGESQEAESSIDENEAAALTFFHWMHLAKGDKTPLQQYLRKLNATQEYYDDLRSRFRDYEEDGRNMHPMVRQLEMLIPGRQSGEDENGSSINFDAMYEGSGLEEEKDVPHGLIPRFGFALVSFRMIGWEAHEDSKDLAIAIREFETKMRTAKGVVAASEGERDAINNVKDAESQRYEAFIRVLVKQGVSPDAAAIVLAQQVRTENIRDSRLTTYVEGGGQSAVMIPADSGSRTTSSPDGAQPQ